MFLASLASVWAALGLAVAIISGSLFSLLIVQLYLRLGEPAGAGAADALTQMDGARALRASPARVSAIVAVGLLAAVGLALLALETARPGRCW